MSDENSGNEEFDDFIDKAIDEMFVPRAQQSASETLEAESADSDQNAVEAEDAVVEAPEEEVDLTISWDQDSSDDDSPQEAAEEHTGPLLFEQPPAPEQPVEEPAQPKEEEAEEGAPKLGVLKPVHEAMLSLDWEISTENIAAVEQAFEDLRSLHGDNYHMESAIKLALITCKYLRASKAYATPLAITYLREAIVAGDVFLSERGPGKPSPDALTNDLLGLYSKMKADANRLRAVALQERTPTEPPAPPKPTPAPAPAAPAPSTGDMGVNPLKEALLDLWDSMEQIRGRLRGASAQGAPFAEAIDASCERFQEELKSAISLSDSQSSAKDEAKLDALDRTANELGAALDSFKAQLAQLRSG
jgi:hypothetical protein